MITLNGTWQMNCKGEDSWQEGQVPGTVYTDLLRNGQMKDPYVGENEDEVRDLCQQMEEDSERDPMLMLILGLASEAWARKLLIERLLDSHYASAEGEKEKENTKR